MRKSACKEATHLSSRNSCHRRTNIEEETWAYISTSRETLNAYLPTPVDLEDQEEALLPCLHYLLGTQILTYSLALRGRLSVPPARPCPLYSRVLQSTVTPGEPMASQRHTPPSILQLVTRLFFSQTHAAKEARPWAECRGTAGQGAGHQGPAPPALRRRAGRTKPPLAGRAWRARTPRSPAATRPPFPNAGAPLGARTKERWRGRALVPPPRPGGQGRCHLGGTRRSAEGRRGCRGGGARSGAGWTEGRGHSRLWAETAAQSSSSRSAAPQSGFMAGEGGGARKSRGKVLGDAGREGVVCARQRRRSGVSRPTGSAGGGGCAAPSRLRLHLGRAGGAAAAAAPPPSPPGALLNQRRARLPPHLGETGWGRAGPAPGPAPTAPLLRNGNGGGAAVRGAGWGAAVPAFYRGCETAPPGRRGGGPGLPRGAGAQLPPPSRGKC